MRQATTTLVFYGGDDEPISVTVWLDITPAAPAFRGDPPAEAEWEVTETDPPSFMAWAALEIALDTSLLRRTMTPEPPGS